MSSQETALSVFKGHEDHNQLLPTETYFQNVGPMQKVSVETVRISADPEHGDVYKLRDGQFPLTKRGLEKIAHAAGISFHPEFSRVEEHRSTYCRYKAVGAMRKADGTLQVVTGTYFIDLELDKKNGMTEARLKERTKFIVQLCESGAKNRAIRSLLGLKSHYKPQELKRPFAVPRIDFAPDMSNPQVVKHLLDQATQSTAQVYAPPAGQEVAALTNGGEAVGQQDGEPVGEPVDDLDDALGEPEPSENEHKVSVFKTMDKAEQTKTFGETVTNKSYPIGTKTKPSDLRKLWLMDRVAAYSELLEWQGGE